MFSLFLLRVLDSIRREMAGLQMHSRSGRFAAGDFASRSRGRCRNYLLRIDWEEEEGCNRPVALDVMD